MTMHDCPDGAMRDLLPLYVGGALGTPDHTRVEAHLTGCADCVAEVELLRAVNLVYPAQAINVANITAKIAAPRRGPVRTTRLPFHRQPLWRAAASVTLFIVGTATVLVVNNRAPADSATAVAQPAAVDGASQTPAETTVASNTPGTVVRRTSNGLLSLGAELSDLTDAQLQTLLGSLEGLDSRPQADPTTIATPIMQERTQAPGRSNQ